MTNLLEDKRFILTLLLITVIAGGFWGSSRYPALNEKAALGGELTLEDPLGFDPLVHLESGTSFVRRVAIVTVNWLYTNRQGMAFGVLLAGAIMALFTLLRRVSFEGTFANTLLGVVVGAPLGVCVNCAAPIARGLHASGARIETALAAMVSSPTLNVIVLTMLFSLFPLYLVVIKLGTTLLFLLVAVPLLARFVFGNERVALEDARRFDSTPPWESEGEIIGERPDTWGSAAVWLAREFGRHLWFIVRTTVPLMFLAGFLGALTITAVPWETLTGQLPFMGRTAVLGTMAGLTVVGLILPVPMAFDVVVAAALLAAGMPLKYVGVLLFTLGVFSIYSFLIVGQAISWRVSTTVTVVLLGLGMVSGVASHVYGEYDTEQKRRFFLEAFEELAVVRPEPIELPEGKRGDALLSSLTPGTLGWSPVEAPTDGIDIERRSFEPTSAPAARLFTRIHGATVGLARADNLPAAFKFTSPFYRSAPIAAGDVHGDGWPDILVGTDRGLYLFANRDGERFERQHVEAPTIAASYIVAAALVDLNDDGWLDIFGNAYRQESFVIYNREGRFDTGSYTPLPPSDAVAVGAAAFADLDGDGPLEIVLGNWSTGQWNPVPPPTSRNTILRRDGTAYTTEPLPGAIGETLSILASDIDDDGNMDLIVGNDFAPPDTYFLGTPSGLRMVTRDDDLVPRTTRSTMSVDTADIDNDLELEIFLAQVTARSPDGRRRIDMQPPAMACTTYDDGPDKRRCEERLAYHEVMSTSLRGQRPSRCLSAATPLLRADCLAFHVLETTRLTRGRTLDLCERLPDLWERLRFICGYSLRKPDDPRPQDDPTSIPQIFNSNVLLQWNDDGRLDDRAVPAGVDIGGWAWNSKFADLDHDEWQDLYVVNGRYRDDDWEPNLLFLNRGDGSFDVAKDAGIGHHLTTASYTYVDVDADGDLDIVELASDGPLWLYRNNRTDGHAVVFEIRDAIGNRFGIGTRLVIRYGDRQQVREIKASGGYLSTDPARAHFGLGTHERVDRVEIRWSTGERSVLEDPFPAGHVYRLTRLGTETPGRQVRAAPPTRRGDPAS